MHFIEILHCFVFNLSPLSGLDKSVKMCYNTSLLKKQVGVILISGFQATLELEPKTLKI